MPPPTDLYRPTLIFTVPASRCKFEIQAMGNHQLGGEDVDEILAEYLSARFVKEHPGVFIGPQAQRRLLIAAELAKCQLSDALQVRAWDCNLKYPANPIVRALPCITRIRPPHSYTTQVPMKTATYA